MNLVKQGPHIQVPRFHTSTRSFWTNCIWLINRTLKVSERMCPIQAWAAKTARFLSLTIYSISRLVGACQLFLGTGRDGKMGGVGVKTTTGKWKMKHERENLKRKHWVCMSECVNFCVCVNVIGDCNGANGFQKGSHNKHEGNQTVEITTGSKHRSKKCRQVCCCLFSIQLHGWKNNVHFFKPVWFLTALWHLVQ